MARPRKTAASRVARRGCWCCYEVIGYQFSLLTLLTVTLLFAVTVGWVGSRMRQAQQNRDRVAAVESTVAEVEELGATVTSGYEEQRSPTWLESLFDDPGGSDDPVRVLKVTRVSFYEIEATDAGLEHLRGLKSLRELNISESYEFTEAGLKHLRALTNLQHLDLHNTLITDAGLEHLKGLTRLEHLNLHSTPVITDAGLAHLSGLTRLKYLGLSEAQVTDAGLEHLKGLKSLQSPHLSYVRVTDAGLEYLKGLTSLQTLVFYGGNVTGAGVEHLKGLTNLKDRSRSSPTNRRPRPTASLRCGPRTP